MGTPYIKSINWVILPAKTIAIPYNCGSSTGHFTMEVAFGPSSFKLDEDSAAVVLESITSGRCEALKVSSLCDRVLSFTVDNRKVGFLLLNKRKFVSPKFICYFYLWKFRGSS